MPYESKYAKMNRELLDIFEKNPGMTPVKRERLEAELQIQYGVSKQKAKETIEAFVTTGRAVLLSDKPIQPAQAKAKPTGENGLTDEERQILEARPPCQACGGSGKLLDADTGTERPCSACGKG